VLSVYKGLQARTSVVPTAMDLLRTGMLLD